MERTAELPRVAFSVESSCERDSIWVALNDGTKSGLSLVDALVVCLVELAGCFCQFTGLLWRIGKPHINNVDRSPHLQWLHHSWDRDSSETKPQRV